MESSIFRGSRDQGVDIVLPTAVIYLFLYVYIISQKIHNELFLLVAAREGNWGSRETGVGEKLFIECSLVL